MIEIEKKIEFQFEESQESNVNVQFLFYENICRLDIVYNKRYNESDIICRHNLSLNEVKSLAQDLLKMCSLVDK